MARGSILLTRGKLGTFASSAPKRGMFPETSHIKALLGALVKCFLTILVHKNI
jgi:hypothetical protein